jgi:flavin-binding protein dodecin
VSVARVTEFSATSETGIEDAISRATSTLRNVEGAWIEDMNVLIEDGNVTGYKVNMEVTFVLEDSWRSGLCAGSRPGSGAGVHP